MPSEAYRGPNRMTRCETVVLIIVYVKQTQQTTVHNCFKSNALFCMYLYLNTLPIYIYIFKAIIFFYIA